MRDYGLLVAVLVGVGCSGGSDSASPELDAAVCGAESAQTRHWVIDTLAFGRIDNGVSDGFDLDSVVSEMGGSTGCGRADVVGPDGTQGIDNAFGELIPALENTEFVAAEALINDTIATGELMLVPWVADLDDEADDDCVEMGLARAVGEPMLGTDGAFLAGQTLSLEPALAGPSVGGMTVEDHSAVGRPVTATIPVQIIDAALEFRIIDGAIRLDMHEDGHASGVMAGGIDVDEVLAVATEQGIAQEVGDILGSLLGVVADLAPGEDGECDQISIVLEYEATPVYVFDD